MVLANPTDVAFGQLQGSHNLAYTQHACCQTELHRAATTSPTQNTLVAKQSSHHPNRGQQHKT